MNYVMRIHVFPWKLIDWVCVSRSWNLCIKYAVHHFMSNSWCCHYFENKLRNYRTNCLLSETEVHFLNFFNLSTFFFFCQPNPLPKAPLADDRAFLPLLWTPEDFCLKLRKIKHHGDMQSSQKKMGGALFQLTSSICFVSQPSRWEVSMVIPSLLMFPF